MDKRLFAARAAGMAGEHELEKLTAYVSRIRGETISPWQAVTLRSVERAALSSWIRKEGLSVQAELLGSSVPFTVEQLLSNDAPLERSPSASPTTTETLPHRTKSGGCVGIDIEEVDNLPRADDYREHPFYQEHFTEVEIAYCLRQADVRASFCGTWAAKEAIVKAGLGEGAIERLATIEVTRDERGRPTHPNCSISISHTPTTAVAICVVR